MFYVESFPQNSIPILLHAYIWTLVTSKDSIINHSDTKIGHTVVFVATEFLSAME